MNLTVLLQCRIINEETGRVSLRQLSVLFSFFWTIFRNSFSQKTDTYPIFTILASKMRVLDVLLTGQDVVFAFSSREQQRY